MPMLPYQDASLPIEKRVADLLARMTLEERCAQLQSQIPWNADVVRRPEVGHVRDKAHFSHTNERRKSPAECAEILNEDQRLAVEGSRLGIPVLQNEESLHGALWGDATMFPQSIAMAATWNPDLVQRIADAIGRELRAVGCRQTLAPVLNLGRDPRWGRTQETYGEDPYLASRMGVAYVRGMECNGVVATPKHFIDNAGDGGRDSNAVHHSQRYLRELDMVPFEAAVRDGKARGIMASFNSLDGIPCSCNRWLLTEVLRGEWGFDGIVVSDYGGVWGVQHAHRLAPDLPEAARMCLEAGLDVDLPEGGTHLADLVRAGRLAGQIVDEAVVRVLKLKFELGLFEQPYVDPEKAAAIVRHPDHVALSLEAARECITLLKNDRQVLPLRKDLRRIGLFGPVSNVVSLGDYSNVFGSAWAGPGITPAQGIRQLVSSETEVVVQAADGDPAVLASSCDVAIIFVTIREDEGGDRSSLALPGDEVSTSSPQNEQHAIIVDTGNRRNLLGNQIGLIQAVAATGVPTVVVLINGSAITMQEWISRVPAVVEAWYAGEQGGLAIAEVLFGDVNPSGRLPMTFPKSVGQVPLNYNVKPSGRGYAYNDDDGKPLFPFGFGLSYTSFTYSNLRLSKPRIRAGEEVEVVVDITNAGPVAGREVVQLYVRDECASVARPLKELRGFARVSLMPGQTRSARMVLGVRELSMWDSRMQFVVEPGWFAIMVGASSEDIRQETVLEVIP